MASISIQIIEGNPQLRSLLGWHLQQLNYGIYQSPNLSHAKSSFQRRQPQVVILDLDLKDGNSIEFCSWLRHQSQVAILGLSNRRGENDIVEGLKAGADDYLCRPFGMQELLARVEALTRRLQAPVPPAWLNYGNLKVDLVQRRVLLQEQNIDLTPQEFSLLYVLVQAEGSPLSRGELLQRAWPDEIDNPRTVDTHVLSLRKKIEVDPRQPHMIQTVRNVGYCFNPNLIPAAPTQGTEVNSKPAPTPPTNLPSTNLPKSSLHYSDNPKVVVRSPL
jgi:two-component system OmpR family response regulator